MEQNKVYAILMQYRDSIDTEQIPILQNALENASDEVYPRLQFVSTKSPMVTLILSIFCGNLGIDRFYLGDIGLGITKLLLIPLVIIFTLGVGSIWALLDIYFCYKKSKKINFKNLMRAING